ncbi:MAG TPA: copper homeostasis protein CutC [Chitinophagaceae bacterium]|nr:copper homeostasis protein CutC [Chitinophagaceae bacterium]
MTISGIKYWYGTAAIKLNKMQDNMKLEIIAFTVHSCKLIEEAGADRIELCDNPAEGGTTPSYGFIKQARSTCSIPIFPMIRPRGGDFLYDGDEFDVMKTDIRACKLLGCDGVVLGILKADGSVDTDRCRELVDLAYPMEVSFHRAFDRTADPIQSLEDVINIGCTRLLSSGCQPTAEKGSALLKTLIEKAGDRIIVMPGSGIRSDNLQDLIQSTGAIEYHSSARIQVPGHMSFQQSSLPENMMLTSVDAEEIRKMAQILKGQPV